MTVTRVLYMHKTTKFEKVSKFFFIDRPPSDIYPELF